MASEERPWTACDPHDGGDRCGPPSARPGTRRRTCGIVGKTFDVDDELISRQWVLDVLAEPVGVEDTEFAAPSSEDLAEPATFD